VTQPPAASEPQALAQIPRSHPPCPQTRADLSDFPVDQDRWAVQGQSASDADEATALIITETQLAGLQPPKDAFTTPIKAVTRVDPAPSRSTYG